MVRKKLSPDITSKDSQKHKHKIKHDKTTMQSIGLLCTMKCNYLRPSYIHIHLRGLGLFATINTSIISFVQKHSI